MLGIPDADARATLGSLLTAAGHTVWQAEGGAAGVAPFRTRIVDAVLTDLGMPEVSGWEVARAVKAERAQIPVILLTGWGEQPPIEPTEQGLVDRVLGKPCRIEDIQAALRDLVRTPSPAARHDSSPDVP